MVRDNPNAPLGLGLSLTPVEGGFKRAVGIFQLDSFKMNLTMVIPNDLSKPC